MGQVRLSTKLYNRRFVTARGESNAKNGVGKIYIPPELRLIEGADSAFGMTTISAAPPSRQRMDMSPVMEPGPDEPTRRPQAAPEL